MLISVIRRDAACHVRCVEVNLMEWMKMFCRYDVEGFVSFSVAIAVCEFTNILSDIRLDFKYTHMNTHMNTHTHEHTHTHACTYTTHTHARMHTHTPHTHTCMYTHIHMHVHTHTHACTHIHMHVHTHTYTCMYTHTHTHACAHTHAYQQHFQLHIQLDVYNLCLSNSEGFICVRVFGLFGFAGEGMTCLGWKWW